MESTGVNWEPNVCKEISGWDPDQNNIFVAVSATNKENPLEYVFSNPFGDSEDVTKDSPSENLYIIDFPEPGNTPLIIAVDQTVNWQPEHVHIPKSWWTTNEVFGYTLTLSSNPATAGTVQGAGTYPVGSKVAVRAIANNGYIFTHWSDADNNEYKDNPYEFNLNGNLTLTANFRQAQNVSVSWSTNLENGVTLTAQDEDGNALTSGTSFREGTMISLNATYNGIDKEFTAWKIGDKVVTFAPAFDYAVDGSGSKTVALIAQFDSPWWDVQLTQDEDGGNIIWSGSIGYDWYKEYRELTNKTDSHKNLVKALKQSFKYLKFEFDPAYNGTITFRCADWNTVIAETTISNKGYYILALTDEMVQNLIDKGGLIAVLQAQNSNNYALTKVKAYTESPVTTFSISVNAETGGSASANKTSAESGEQVTLTATANPGYTFLGWKTTEGTVASTQNPWTFSVTSNVSYTASFAEAAKFTITASSNDESLGTVSITDPNVNGQYYEGTAITMTAVATNGVFVKWTKDNSDASTSATLNLTASQSTAGAYQAVFRVKESYRVTLTAGENGTAAINTASNASDEKYYEGTEVTFTAAPVDGYRVARWTKNGSTIAGKTNTLTITVSGNDSYGVEFEEKPAGPIVLWNAGLTTGGSGSCSKIDINANALTMGMTLKIYYSNSWLNIHYGEWNQQSYSESYNPNCKYKVLTEDDIAKIKDKGLYVQGDNTTVTEVTIE